MAFIEPLEDNHDDVWFLDSGYSNHICGDLSLFNEIEEEIKKTVRLGNHTQMKVMEKRSVRLFIQGVSHLV